MGRLAASLVHKSLLQYPAVSSVIFAPALSCAQSLLTYHRVGKQSSQSHAHSMVRRDPCGKEVEGEMPPLLVSRCIPFSR